MITKTIEQRITDIVEGSINVFQMWVENESHHHSGTNTNSHFKVIIVSDDFKNKTMLQRHQQLNQLLNDIFKKVHALSIRAYSLGEWDRLIDKPVSPVCASKQSSTKSN